MAASGVIGVDTRRPPSLSPARRNRRQRLSAARRAILAAQEMISCACGCGSSLLPTDDRGRPRKFIHAHWSKANREAAHAHLERGLVAINHGRGRFRADGKHWRTARYRARSMTNHSCCSWLSIGYCKGKIQVAHVNGDYTNNDASNRLALCVSHHSLLDNGRINPNNPIMPPFYIDGSGKRRYPKDTPRKKESKCARQKLSR